MSLAGVTLLSLGVPLIFWKWTMQPFITPKSISFYAGFTLLLISFIAAVLSDKKYRPDWKLIWPPVLYFGVIFLWTMLFGSDRLLALAAQPERQTGLVFLFAFSLLPIMLSSLREFISWRFAVYGVFVSSILTALPLIFWNSSLDKFFLSVTKADRAAAWFGNPTYAAGFMLLSFFGLLAFGFMETGKKRIIAFVSAGLSFGGILMTQTRGDLGGLLIGFFVFALVAGVLKAVREKKISLRNYWLSFLAVMVLIFAGWYFTRSASFWRVIPGYERISDSSVLLSGMQNRFYAWGSLWKGIKEKPLTGWGWENANYPFNKYYDPRLVVNDFAESSWDKPHNTFIEHLVVAGIFGLLAYLVFLFWPVYLVFKNDSRDLVKAAYVGGLVSYMVRSAVIFDTVGTYVLLALAFGYALHISSKKDGWAEKIIPHSSFEYTNLFAGIAVGLVFVFLVPIPLLRSMKAQWLGTNYYLNSRFPQSYASYEEARGVWLSPHARAILIGEANLIKNAAEKGVQYPEILFLSKDLAESLRRLIKDNPNNYYYPVFMAGYLNVFGSGEEDLKEAKEMAQKALSINPNRQEALYHLAKTNLLLGDKEAARDSMEKAVLANPSAGDPRFFYSVLLFDMGNIKEAIIQLEESRRLGREPKSVDEAATIGDILGDKAGDYAGAVKYYALARDLAVGEGADSKKIARLGLKEGIAWYLAGDYRKAKEEFNRYATPAVVRELPMFENLEPVFKSLGVTY